MSTKYLYVYAECENAKSVSWESLYEVNANPPNTLLISFTWYIRKTPKPGEYGSADKVCISQNTFTIAAIV